MACSNWHNTGSDWHNTGFCSSAPADMDTFQWITFLSIFKHAEIRDGNGMENKNKMTVVN